MVMVHTLPVSRAAMMLPIKESLHERRWYASGPTSTMATLPMEFGTSFELLMTSVGLLWLI